MGTQSLYILIFSIGVLLSTVVSLCPPRWLAYKNQCYFVGLTLYNWNEASMTCGARNATLTTVLNNNEKTFLVLKVKPLANRNHTFWVGLSRNSKSLWVWSDNTKYTRKGIPWIRGFPKADQASTALNCGVMDPKVFGRLRQINCAGMAYFICKRDSQLYDICDSANGWHEVNGRCYKFNEIRMNFFDARQSCQSKNGDLVVAHNRYDLNVFLDTVMCQSIDNYFWIGISDVASPGKFMNIDKTPLNYTNWMMPRGNLIWKKGNTCVQVIPLAQYKWESMMCLNTAKFVCSKPIGVCPSGWLSFLDTCYQINASPRQQKSWTGASTACQSEGAMLAEVKSSSVQQFLFKAMLQVPVSTVWIGLSDQMKDDTFAWVDGSKVVYNGWVKPYPTPTPNQLDCGTLNAGAKTSSWANGYCFTRNNYICQIKLIKQLTTGNTTSNINGSCDDGWIPFKNNCYFFGKQQNWTTAADFCQQSAGNLTSIRNNYEQGFLSDHMDKSGGFWIGLQQQNLSNPSTYSWIDGSKLMYKNYLPGEPNSKNGACIQMLGGSQKFPGSWKTAKCNALSNRFVCRKPRVMGPTLFPIIPSLPTIPPSIRCGPGWLLNSRDNYCYRVFTYRQNWAQAFAKCHSIGSGLLSISGPREQNYISGILSVHPQYRSITQFWIGATDKGNNGGWAWSDKSPFKYLYFHPGQPSNNVIQNCAQMVSYWNYMWKAYACTTLLPYICKKPAAPLPTPLPTGFLPLVVPCRVAPMISGTYSVQDSALTASTSIDANHKPQNSRIVPGNKACWSPKVNNVNQYIQATFYNPIVITGIMLMGCARKKQYVSKYKVMYQYDVQSHWETYMNPPGKIATLTGNFDTTTGILLNITYPFEAQMVRLVPVTWSKGISLKWDLYGCIKHSCSPEYTVNGPLFVGDGAFNISSSNDPLHVGEDSRINPTHSISHPNGWEANMSSSLPNEWISVDLGNVMTIRGITTYGQADAPNWVTSYNMSYSTDGSTYVYYQQPYGTVKIFTGNHDNKTAQTNYLASYIQARFVMLNPLNYSGAIALRFDVLACPIGCSSEPLIVGRKPVKNSQLTASSSQFNSRGPSRSRLKTQAAPSLSGGWVAKINDKRQYIQVDLGQSISINGIATQGRQDSPQWVTSYKLSYSRDGKAWKSYMKNSAVRNFNGNWDRNTVRKYYLQNPFLARYVRLWPQAYHQRIALRWEVYGCPGVNSGTVIGCYMDNVNARDLPFEPYTDPVVGMYPPMCIRHCFNKGYFYGGIQNTNQCFCGDTYGKYGPSKSCTLKCNPKVQYICGGTDSNLIVSTGLDPQTRVCSAGWKSYGNNCYMAKNMSLSWQAASLYCGSQGAYLASINSLFQQRFVYSFLQLAGGDAWIGLNDIQQEMFFQWSHNDPELFTNWNAGEPQDNPAYEEDCVMMAYKNGGWQDDRCSAKKGLICQKPKQMINSPTMTPAPSGCQQGWTAYRWSCYLFAGTKRTWKAAQSTCKAFSGNLVRIGDRFEQAFLSSQMGKLTGQYWSDVSDQKKPGLYQYSDGTQFIPFTNWAMHNPKNQGSCVSLGTGQMSGLWFDVGCSTPMAAVCEQPRLGFTSPPPTPAMLTVSSGAAKCADGSWIPLHGFCYQINTVPRSHQLFWVLARQACHRQGAELASFHSVADFNYIWRNFLLRTTGNYWIGLTNSNSQSQFKWTDGTPAQLFLWATKEPDNRGKVEHCVEVNMATGMWNDLPCWGSRNWICKMPIGVPVSTHTTPLIPTAGSSTMCTKNGLISPWQYFNGYCYYLNAGLGDQAATWRQARNWCHNWGGDLASITNMQQQLFLQNMIQNVSHFKVWIGLNELDWDNGYRWSDGNILGIRNWAYAEPDDTTGSESCINMYVRDGKWNDEHCAVKTGYICEVNINAPTLPAPTPYNLTGYCPHGFSQYKKRCYKVVSNVSLSWPNARYACEKIGKRYDLASIINAGEQAFLTTLVYGVNAPVWIGLRRLYNNELYWADNEEMTYTNWKHDEPSAGKQERCGNMLTMDYAAGKWTDLPCSTLNGFICQTFVKPSITTPPVPPTSKCPTGFSTYKQDCFQLVTTNETWQAANTTCAGMSSHLVSITSIYEESFIYLLLNNGVINVTAIWTGLNDIHHTGQYSFTDGWPVLYTNWAANQPVSGPGKGCVLATPTGSWSDMTCSQAHPFVCKITSAKPPPTPQIHSGRCPGPHWKLFGGYCYLFKASKPVTYPVAAFECQIRRAHIVSVHNTLENNLVTMSVSLSTNAGVWTSLFLSRDAGYTWKDNSPANYFNWAQNQPQMNKTAATTVKACVELQSQGGKWDTVSCYETRGFVCKRPSINDGSAFTFPGPGATFPSTKPTTAATKPAQKTSAMKKTSKSVQSTQKMMTSTPKKMMSTAPTPKMTQRIPVTNNQPVTKPLTSRSAVTQAVHATKSPTKGLSSGGVAGIVITMIVLAIIGILGGICFVRRRGRMGFRSFHSNYHQSTNNGVPLTFLSSEGSDDGKE